MAARTAQRTRQATDTITEVQSVTLVRNILRSSVSSIAYLRYLFPEDNFEDTQLAGLKIKSLVPSSNPEVAAINNWLEKGVFDALEKHYLKAMVFSIFSEPNNPASLLESYTFKFSYPSDNRVSLDFTANSANGQQNLTFMSKEQIQQAWCTMIRTLITLSHTLPPLPSQRNLAMRLYYYEDVTPADYDPPGFDNASSDPDFEFIAETERIEVGGSVRTRHHAVSLRLDTALGAIGNAARERLSTLGESARKVLVAAFEADNGSAAAVAAGLGVAPNSAQLEADLQMLVDAGFLDERRMPLHTPENDAAVSSAF